MKRKELLGFVFVLLIGFFFRFYRIEDVPFGLNNDASWEGLAALDILRGNIAPYFPYATEGWRGEGLFRLIVAPFTYFLGPIPLVIKLPSAILGFLTLIPLYFLVRQLFSRKLAFITAFLVATSGWHITMSKAGWRCIGVPLFSLAAFYFLFRGLKTKKSLDFILTGVMFAGSLYTYDAARILPFFFVFWMAILVLTKKVIIKENLRGLTLASVACLIIAFPLLVYAKNHWENFISRGDFLFIGHQIKRTGNLAPFWNNLKNSALLFNYRANGNDFFINEPLVDKPASWLFPLGLLIAVLKIFKGKKNYLFMLLFLIAFLIPGILSTPNGNRGIGALPAVYFFSALGLVFIVEFLVKFIPLKKQTISLVIIGIFLTYVSFLTYKDYLGPTRRELFGFYPETYITLNYIKGLQNKADYDFYFIDNYPRELLTFLLYQPGQKNPFSKNYVWLERNVDLLNVIKTPQKGVAFVMFDNYFNQNIANALLQKYPNGQKLNLPYKNENILRPASIIILAP